MSIPDLQSPYSNKEDYEKHNKGSSTLLLILVGIIVCLILIIIFLLLAPAPDSIKNTEEQNLNISKNQQQGKKIPEAEIKNSTEEKKSFDENIQIEWLLKKTEAEKNNTSQWASQEFNEAVQMSKQAEQFKQQDNYQQAENYYQQATQIISKTVAEKEQRRDELLQQAEHFLQNDDLIQAKQLFESALLIEPENDRTKKGLSRLKTRIEVNQLYQLALEQKDDKRMNKAISYLEQALLLERENKKTKEKLHELKEIQVQSTFNEIISFVLSAIDNNDLNKARNELAQAKKLKKNDPAIKELENIINEKNRKLAISQLKKQADNQEANEQWQKALNSYKKIIDYDPDTTGAKTNLQRVKNYINLNQLLDNIVLKPQRLQNEKVLEKSKNNLIIIKVELEQKRKLMHPIEQTPKLLKKIALAEKIVNQASEKIILIIKSDNETDIVIYKVGKFGKLKEKKVILRPGQYTIVGSRPGYRDFRKKINISASDTSHTIDVQCQEKI